MIERGWRNFRGKPLDMEAIVRECVASGIDEADSRVSIGWLDVDGRITVRSGRVV